MHNKTDPIRSYSPDESISTIVDQFKQDGYIVLKGAFKRDDLMKAQSQIKSIQDQSWRVKYANKNESVREISNVYSSNSLISNLIKNSKAVNIIKTIIGDDLFLFRDAYIEKLPNPSSRFPLHQDSEFWKVEPEALVSMWIPFQDSSEKNGVLNVVPRSHTLKLEHSVKLGERLELPQFINSLLRQSAKNSDSTGSRLQLGKAILVWIAGFINARLIPFLSRHFNVFEKFTEFFVVKNDAHLWKKAVSPTLEVGDLIIYHSLTLHGSRGNTSSDPRAAYIPTFMGSRYTINGLPVSAEQFGFIKIS